MSAIRGRAVAAIASGISPKEVSVQRGELVLPADASDADVEACSNWCKQIWKCCSYGGDGLYALEDGDGLGQGDTLTTFTKYVRNQQQQELPWMERSSLFWNREAPGRAQAGGSRRNKDVDVAAAALLTVEEGWDDTEGANFKRLMRYYHDIDDPDAASPTVANPNICGPTQAAKRRRMEAACTIIARAAAGRSGDPASDVLVGGFDAALPPPPAQ